MLKTDRMLGLIEGLAERVARLEARHIREGERLGNRIRALLDEKELTVADLAMRINRVEGPDIAASTLQQIIDGNIETPTQDAINVIARALDVSADSLFGLLAGGKDASEEEGRF